MTRTDVRDSVTEKEERTTMKIMENIPACGDHEEKMLVQVRTCAATADRAALVADGHLGYAVPIGGVVAYKDAISPSGVGFDIACGNKAVRLDMPGEELSAKIGTIMDEVWATLSFGVGRKNSERVEHEIFDRTHAGGDLQATGLFVRRPRASLALSAPVTTMWTSSQTKRTACGLVCISARVAPVTALRRGS
jgi:tRNA-splicing ligase RtcB